MVIIGSWSLCLYFGKEFNMIDFNNKFFTALKWICGTVLGVAGVCVIGYVATDDNRKELRQAEIEKEYPPEYWTAKAAEQNYFLEADRLKIESRERLEIDGRERDMVEKDKQRAYELNAPEGYWLAKMEKEKSDALVQAAKIEAETKLKIARETNDTRETVARENRWAQESSDRTQRKIAEASSQANAEIMKTAFDGMMNIANAKKDE